MMYREGLFEQELIFEQFNNQPPEPPPSQPVSDPGGAITGLTSNTLTVGGKVGTLQNVEAPQAIGPGASPRFNALSPVDVSGTNQPGLNFDLSGGPGTGNALPGHVVVRYPLTGASGATLQSLSADRFPVSTSLYTNTGAGTAVTNTTTETSLFTGATPSSGSTRTVQGGSSRAGTRYPITIVGQFITSGSPTIRIRVKLGSTTICDTGVVTSPNNSAGSFILTAWVYINSIGASGSVRADMEGRLNAAAAGAPVSTYIVGGIGPQTIDLTADQAFDVTAEWGTASSSNIIALITASIVLLCYAATQ